MIGLEARLPLFQDTTILGGIVLVIFGLLLNIPGLIEALKHHRRTKR